MIKTEMDLMKMDTVRRWAWLHASRVTLAVAGLVWLGWIGWEILQGRIPVFMLLMIPTIALIRFLLFRYYLKKSNEPKQSWRF